MGKEVIIARAIQFVTNAREQEKHPIAYHVSGARAKDFFVKRIN